MKGQVHIIQGAQYGSEGKGQVAALFAEEAAAAIRTGSINAGHSVHYEGTKYVMQQIPTAWIHDQLSLFIGPGAYIHPETLERELDLIREATGKEVGPRLYVDYRCHLHQQEAENAARTANRHHEMGATGKGSSEAVKQKLDDRSLPLPSRHSKLFHNHPLASRVQIADVPHMLMKLYRRGHTLLLEGTQGASLDLHLGPWPFVTNRGCNAATWMQEAGLSPSLNTTVTLVTRTMPIRVAGNSGPLPNEVSWFDLLHRWRGAGLPIDIDVVHRWHKAHLDRMPTHLVQESGEVWDAHRWNESKRWKYRVLLSETPMQAYLSLSEEDRSHLSKWVEMTTVTKKPRRIADFDKKQFERALEWNCPDNIVLTFLNYWAPHLWGKATPPSCSYYEAIEEFGVPVTHVTTGPLPQHMIPTRDA